MSPVPLPRMPEVHARELTGRGWTEEDLAALSAYWARLTPGAFAALVRACRSHRFRDATPEQVRAWLRVCCTTVRRNRSLGSSAWARLWRAETFSRAADVPAWDAIQAYLVTTCGDHALALALIDAGLSHRSGTAARPYVAAVGGNRPLAVLAHLAGLSPGEAATRHAAGSLDEAGLRLLIGLREAV